MVREFLGQLVLADRLDSPASERPQWVGAGGERALVAAAAVAVRVHRDGDSRVLPPGHCCLSVPRSPSLVVFRWSQGPGVLAELLPVTPVAASQTSVCRADLSSEGVTGWVGGS